MHYRVDHNVYGRILDECAPYGFWGERGWSCSAAPDLALSTLRGCGGDAADFLFPGDVYRSTYEGIRR